MTTAKAAETDGGDNDTDSNSDPDSDSDVDSAVAEGGGTAVTSSGASAGPLELSRSAALLPAMVAAAYVVVGIAFFLDPSAAETTGTDAYWDVLAEAGFGRRFFLFAFAMVGVLALGAIGSIRAILAPHPSGFLQWGFSLGYLGYAVTAVSYFRILSGEADRAKAFSDGAEETRDAIASFSIGLDPDGWLMFGATGVFLGIINAVSLSRNSWPRWLSVLGLVIAGMSLLAWFGLLADNSQVVNVAVGVGGIVLGPIWWAGLSLVVRRLRLGG